MVDLVKSMRVLWVLSCLVVFLIPRYARGQSDLPSGSVAQAGRASEQVELPFSVRDPRGDPVVGLSPSDVEVTDDARPVRILDLRPAAELPTYYALVLDMSRSGERSRNVSTYGQATVEFLRSRIRPGVDAAVVVPFRDKVSVSQEFDPERLSEQLRNAVYRGGSALHDAIYSACEDLDRFPGRNPGRRVVVVLSDGEDNMSEHTQEEVVRAANLRMVQILCHH